MLEPDRHCTVHTNVFKKKKKKKQKPPNPKT